MVGAKLAQNPHFCKKKQAFLTFLKSPYSDNLPSIIENIRQYHKKMNSTIIMVTHSMEEAARNADRMVVMNQGSIYMDGTPGEIFSRSDELFKMNLAVPEVTRIALRLRSMGLPVDPSVYTVEQLKASLHSLRGGERHA